MGFTQMRYAAQEGAVVSPLADLALKALQQENELTFRSLRAPGFRALAPLMDKAQVVIDKAVVEVGLQRLTFVADLLAEGLTYDLTDPLSMTHVEWNKSNKVGAAQRVMTPSARTENKLPTILPSRLPVYITLDGFQLDIRTLKMSQRVGTPLDVANIKSCTRSVNEAIEDAAINGATTLDGQDLYVGGYSAPGLLNAPNANTKTLTASAWAMSTSVGTTVQAEVLDMISKLQADKKYGPYNLYVPTATGIALNQDFKANGNDSILQRLQEIEVGGRKLRIRTADMLPATKVALVQMTSDVVDIVDGQRPTVVPWTSLDGFTVHNLVMGIMITRFRSDYDGNSGVCIGTLT